MPIGCAVVRHANARIRTAYLTAPVSAFCLFLTLACAPVLAAEPVGTLRGHVVGTDGLSVAAARVSVDGPAHVEAVTDTAGVFHLERLAAGAYTVRVERAGYERGVRTGVLVEPGVTAALEVTLANASFSSLAEIGRSSTASSVKNGMNTGSSSAAVIPRDRFSDGGQLQVGTLLNEIPGVITTVDPAAGANGASRGDPSVPQVRGALAYETQSLIDGHPVSVGANGEFSPLLIHPALLQNVEIAKGPSATPLEINYAIGGSVNYRTLEPTAVPHVAAEAGIDGYGGLDTSLRATGSFFDRRVAYAFGVATLGTPGSLNPLQVASSQLLLAYGSPPYSINGQAFVGPPLGIVAGNTPNYAGIIGAIRLAEPLYLCCSPVTTGFSSRGELGKLRFDLSGQTSLTLSYLGGQSLGDLSGTRLGSLQTPFAFSTFAPPAGYAGGIAPGTPIPFDNQAAANLVDAQQQNLFQAELRSAIGPVTVLARAYAGYSSDVIASSYAIGSPLSLTQNAWGGALLCPAGAVAHGATCVLPGGASTAPVLTFFNGQPTTIFTNAVGAFAQTVDHVSGQSFELDRPIGAAVVALGFDRSVQASWQFALSPSEALDEYVVPPGSQQQFTTLSARISLPVARRVTANVSDYQIWYASHYSGNGGVTWSDAVHAFDAPRFALGWRPAEDVAVRFALGASIAPPYIGLLSAPGGQPVANAPGAATAYTLNENNGQIAPEEAFGYDLGTDWRIAPRLTLSTDVYRTSLRNMFLESTFQQGTYTPVSGADAGNTQPLYVTVTQNLGHARYDGIEAALVQAPPAGFGFIVNLALTRAYAYDISPALYATAAGPYTANLGILRNVNFQSGGTGFNGISNGRVPYAQGYGEANYRTSRGSLVQFGVQYYGANNAFNRPAFAAVSAAIRWALNKQLSFHVSGYNLTNAYAQPYTDTFGGVPVALANGSLGATIGLNLGPASVRAGLRYMF